MSEEKTNFFQTNRELLVFTALAFLVVIIYWQTTRFGFVNLDDNLYVFENAVVLSGLNWNSLKWALTSFHSANWHPLTWVSHQLDAQLFGGNPGAQHAVNIIFHLINSILAFVVFRKMTGCFVKSALVAALFAVHPAHVESVAWISERKDVLSTLFWLLTMWAYLRFADSRAESSESRVESRSELRVESRESRVENKNQEQTTNNEELAESENKKELSTLNSQLSTPDSRLPTKFYLLALVFFALGLMSKPMLVTLPFVLLLCDFWPLERLKNLKDLPALIVEKIPFFVLSAASCWVTILAQRSAGAVETLDALPLEVRFFNTLVSYAKYVVMLFYPANLGIWYPYEQNFPWWQIAAAALLLAAVTVLCVRQIRERKYLLTGWCWFLGTLVPVIGLVQVGSQSLADRYTYIPYFGLLIMLVWGLSDLGGQNRKAFLAIFCAVIIIFAGLSYRQASFWQSSETIYRRTLAVTHKNFLIEHNLCHTLTVEDRVDEAEPFCRAAMESKPNFFEVNNTLGVLQLKRGQYAEAEQSFREVLRNAPDYALVLANLSVALALQNKPEEAEENLEKSVRFGEGLVDKGVWINALNTVAAAFNAQQKHEKALENLMRILTLAPDNGDARANIALTLYRLKRYDEAQQQIEIALRLNPDQAAAYNTYGLILLEKNRKAEAAGLFEKALQLKPDLTEARENLKKAGKAENFR